MQRLVTKSVKIIKNINCPLWWSKRNLKTTACILNKHVSAADESFLSGSCGQYLEDMYNAWIKDPKSVHASWDSYFRNSAQGGSGYYRPPTLAPSSRSVSAVAPATTVSPAVSASPTAIEEHLTVQALIKSYQARGHLVAKTNPLEQMFDLLDKNTTSTQKFDAIPPEILRHYKITPSMWDTQYQLPSTCKIGGKETHLTLKEIVKRLELAYCRHIGVEYMHIIDADECHWIRDRFEPPGVTEIKKSEKRLMLTRLARATLFEAFLQKKWSSEKRFGLEGCEVLVTCLKSIIDITAINGAELFVIGMPHRGRLNTLANICRKPLEKIFCQFYTLQPVEEGSGDVKYHLGVYEQMENKGANKKVSVALVANPSHLEMVNPVCAGRARAEQFLRGDKDGKLVVPLLMHGDAAFAGEGVVYETLQITGLPCYNVGGTIHVVVNNQIGFTTDPMSSRSSPHCTDVAKVINAPIFHVNSEDPDAVVHVSKVAAEWRQRFHKDVVIDIVCYRRYGHNEMDEPMFTQPIMYKKIKQMKNIFEKYCELAVKTGVTNEAEINNYKKEYEEILEADFAKATKETNIKFSDWIDCPWKGFKKITDSNKCAPTGVSEDILTHIANKFSHPPPGDFVIHKALERVMTQRQEMVKNRTADWAVGEALAFGSLVKEGIHVRLSGQDVERGTFSQRHHVVHHQTKDKTKYTYLQDLYPDQAPYTICNSPISEYGVVGFEHGFSMTSPNLLVLWEAQFGDFANNAQAVFDNMISSGQTKWIRQSGLVCLLPHGKEGQGPEHSSARIERYLELCCDDPDYLPPDSPDFAVKQLRDINWIVANCTTPANFFHILRRQLKLPFRKPLMIMTPKSLLRLPEARSSFDEMKEGTEFHRLIPENGPASKNPSNVYKIIFCSGKVYFDFVKAVKEKKLEDKIAVARIEQMCPFPYDLVRQECQKYSKAQIVWGQEEHKNSGCWNYMHPRFETALKGERDIIYVGRHASASTATGNKNQYLSQLKSFLDDATKCCGEN